MNVEVLALGIPILALMIPIVAILTNHQRKMAEIIHNSHAGRGDAAEIAALRAEVAELKELVQSQMIAIDGLASRGALTPPRLPEQQQTH